MRLTRSALLLLLIAWGFLLIEYAVRVSDSAIIPELMRSFTINNTGIALLSSSYYFAYIIMQIPAGFVIDKLGLKHSLSIAMAIVAIGCILLAHAQHLPWACMARILMGVGSAFAFISAVKIISQRQQKSSFLVGITMTMATLGAVLGQEPWLRLTLWLRDWRQSYLIAAILLLVLIVMSMLTKSIANTQPAEKQPPITSINFTWRLKIKLLFYIGCLSAPITAFAALWGIPFFFQHLHFSRDLATSIIAASWLGGLVGGPLLGYLADHYFTEIKLLSVIGLLTTALFLIMLFLPLTINGYVVVLFCMGLLCNGNVIIFSYFSQHCKLRQRGMMTGLCNTFNMGVGPILQLFIAYTLQLTQQQYTLALAVIPLLLLITTGWLMSHGDNKHQCIAKIA